MAKRPDILNVTPAQRLVYQPYERYNPTAFNDSLSILEKINKMIYQLNMLGELSNDLVKQWNQLVDWIIGNGLNEIVREEIDKRIDNGTFDNLFNHILGDLDNLETDDKAKIVNAINEVYKIAILNRNHIGNMPDLLTDSKGDLVSAINELNIISKSNEQATITIGEATGYGIISGFKVVQQTVLSMAVNIGNSTEPNIIHMPSGVRYVLDSIALAVDESDQNLNRMDIVYVSKEGVITYKAGVLASQPIAPVLPNGGVLLANIIVLAKDTVINNSDIVDKREMKSLKQLLTKNKSNFVQAINEVILNLENVITEVVGDKNDLLTTDKRTIVNAVNEIFLTMATKIEIGKLTELLTNDKTSLVSAINDIVENYIGNLATLATDNKDTIVNAINSSVLEYRKLIGDLSLLDVVNKDDLVSAINESVERLKFLEEKIGDLTKLETIDKTTIVNAINEVVNEIKKLSVSVNEKIGNLDGLLTSDKVNLVNAINENFESIQALEINSGYDISVKQFGAVGDGVTDDTIAVENALKEASKQKKRVVFPSGAYKITRMIIVTGDISGMYGVGEVLINSVGLNYQVFRFEGVEDFTIENLNFSNDLQNESTLIWVTDTNNFKVRDCSFVNTGGSALSFSKTTNTDVTTCYFNNTGRTSVTIPSHPSKPAIWVGEAPMYTNFNVYISDCTFEKCNWSGVYFFAHVGVIRDCVFLQCGESSIFVDYYPTDIFILNNTIRESKTVNIAGFGVELGGVRRCLVDGNTIVDCDEAGIAVAAMQEFTITNNKCINNGKGNGSIEQQAGLVFRLISSDCINGVVSNNIFIDNKVTDKVQKYAISTMRYGVGSFYVASTIFTGNDFTGNAVSPVYLYDNGVFLGDNVLFSNNAGYADRAKTIVFEMDTTGVKELSGFGFRPRSAQIIAYAKETAGSKCTGEISFKGTGVSNCVSEFAGKFKADIYAWVNLDDLGNTINYGEVAGVSNDGFNVNIGYAQEGVTLMVTCYP